LPDSPLAEYDGAVPLLAKNSAPPPPPETSPSGLSPIFTSLQCMMSGSNSAIRNYDKPNNHHKHAL
jgi:hypothetical protein